ncbi:MAG: polysaccharide deacetylase family protein [Gammaproteobacteria bacterium]|nr:polysaccharide deacetylase family protein [Gammaproteobacteria bacterium]
MTSRTMSIVQIFLLPFTCITHMALAEAAIPAHAVILQYHHVSAETPTLTSIHPDEFQAHLDHLQQQKFIIWSLDRIIDAIIEHKPIPDKTVAITFDDAYLSVYKIATPLLKAMDWPFTVFVSSNLIDSNRNLYMSWSQLREIQADGALIANHTMNHTHLLRHLAGETEQQWRDRIIGEIQGARLKIKQETGTDTNLFAYPYGEFDAVIKTMVKDLGIVAFGQHSGPLAYSSDLQALPRFPASGAYSDLDSLKLKLNTLPFPIRSSLPNPLLPIEDVRPILEVELDPGEYLFDQLACYTSQQGRNAVLDRLNFRFRTRSNAPLAVGRSRYNCTMPEKDGRRYYWFSQPWIRLNPDGTWYPEE